MITNFFQCKAVFAATKNSASSQVHSCKYSTGWLNVRKCK